MLRRVRIIGCERNTYWYSDCIGKVFTVNTQESSTDDDDYLAIRGDFPEDVSSGNAYIARVDTIDLYDPYQTQGDSKLKHYFI